MLKFFKVNPIRKLRKQYDQKLTQAMDAQHYGNVQEYSKFNDEAEALFEQIEKLEMNCK